MTTPNILGRIWGWLEDPCRTIEGFGGVEPPFPHPSDPAETLRLVARIRRLTTTESRLTGGRKV